MKITQTKQDNAANSLYAVLELPDYSTISDVKASYKKLALKNHPDRVPLEKRAAATTRFQAIASAYETLGDEEKKQRYDHALTIKENTAPLQAYYSTREKFSADFLREFDLQNINGHVDKFCLGKISIDIISLVDTPLCIDALGYSDPSSGTSILSIKDLINYPHLLSRILTPECISTMKSASICLGRLASYSDEILTHILTSHCLEALREKTIDIDDIDMFSPKFFSRILSAPILALIKTGRLNAYDLIRYDECAFLLSPTSLALMSEGGQHGYLVLLLKGMDLTSEFIYSPGYQEQVPFQPEHLQKMADKLLLWVMYGEQDKAEKILKRIPELLTMDGEATDCSGRTFKTTAFRYALWALDIRYMCKMMVDCLPNNPKGKNIRTLLLKQCEEQSTKGSSYTLNGKTIHEKEYNFLPLILAIDTYVNEKDKNRAEQKWSKVALLQKDVPVHVAQHYCDPEQSFVPTPSFDKKTFKRSLTFFSNRYPSDSIGQPEVWFSPKSNRAVTHGILRGSGNIAWASYKSEGKNMWSWPGVVSLKKEIKDDGRADLEALITLDAKRHADFLQLMEQLNDSKPDLDHNSPPCVIS